MDGVHSEEETLGTDGSPGGATAESASGALVSPGANFPVLFDLALAGALALAVLL